MSPTVVCIRHAQGYHNLGKEYHSMSDPRLTKLGERQCSILKNSGIVDHSKVSVVTASPLTRTIHTAYLLFRDTLETEHCHPAIIALPDTQESTDYPCDIGTDVDQLQEQCANEKWPVDLSRLDTSWNKKAAGTRYSASSQAITRRANAARKQIRQILRDLVDAGNPDAQVVLVTHGGYLHYFTEDWTDSDKYPGTGWSNTEARTYTFTSSVHSDDERAALTETKESLSRRGRHN